VLSWLIETLRRPESEAVRGIVELPALGRREASAFRMVWRGIESMDTALLRWFKKDVGTCEGNCEEDGSDVA